MAEIAYWEAIRRAHDEEMAHDKLVIAMGEDIGVAGGTYKATSGLYDKYGPERIIDTPISENSYTGIGIGASMVGMRPIIEIMSINFALLALDTLINAAAKIRYMSGGQIACPIVMRTPGGTAHQLAAQHSARLAQAGINVEYMYAFVQHSGKNAVIIFRFDNLDEAINLLQKEGIHIYKGEEVYRL